ncbi:MAG: CRTAC1 family protein [Deltaproteobacteria bacterium]|nr:CRTAC1 family protein [Deltaproteobacteria bacterium]
MSRGARRRGSRRTQGVWLSLLWTGLGIALLTAVALWLNASRDTDLSDPTADVTAAFKTTQGVELPPIRFRDVAASLGVSMRHGPGERSRELTEDTGSGIAWGDYDGDGDWDLYVVNFPSPLGSEVGDEASNRLFRNEGDRFSDVTEAAGVSDADGFGMGATFADYDGDGDLDLYVTNRGRNRLFRNRGGGRFDEVAQAAGVADPLWSMGATWGDFDRDGHLDLYVCNYVAYDDAAADLVGDELEMIGGAYTVPFTLNPNAFDPQPNRLYHNLGDGSFEEIAVVAGVHNPGGRSMAATFVDLDGDGWLDLYVNNDVSANRLYRNLQGDLGATGGMAFDDISALTGTADGRGSMGLSVGEIGGMHGEADGLPDLFITHWIAQENAFYQSLKPEGHDLEYRDKTRLLRLGEISIARVGWGTGLVDLDLDGRLDIAVANGSTQEHSDDPRRLIAEPLFLFWNDGKRFHDVAGAAGEAAARGHWARGLAAADFDGDGDVDLAVAINRGSPLLLRNETEPRGKSLRIRLGGPATARFGARVEVVAAGERQIRWLGSDVSYLGMHAPELIFGLAQDDSASEVHVRYADGVETSLYDVPAGLVEVAHPSAAVIADAEVRGDAEVRVDPEARSAER